MRFAEHCMSVRVRNTVIWLYVSKNGKELLNY